MRYVFQSPLMTWITRVTAHSRLTTLKPFSSTWLGTGAVSVATVGAGGVVAAVPALAISRSLLRVDTLVDGVVENEAVSAAQLNGVHPKLAVDVLPAGSGVGEGWVSKWLAIGTNRLTVRELKALNVWLASDFSHFLANEED